MVVAVSQASKFRLIRSRSKLETQSHRRQTVSGGGRRQCFEKYKAYSDSFKLRSSAGWNRIGARCLEPYGTTARGSKAVPNIFEVMSERRYGKSTYHHGPSLIPPSRIPQHIPQHIHDKKSGINCGNNLCRCKKLFTTDSDSQVEKALVAHGYLIRKWHPEFQLTRFNSVQISILFTQILQKQSKTILQRALKEFNGTRTSAGSDCREES
ncbi:hypothetical protein CPC08DRAFT_753122 [Agrocybe pediades]|nr:hypothetical protein CPC08DRAFT_753122 [Agrocybe pediades]